MVDDIREIFNVFHASKQTELGPHNARALHEFVQATSERMGIANPPRIIHIDHPLPMAAAGIGREEAKIYLSEGILKGVCDATHIETHVPDGLKAVIAHELSHVADGYNRAAMPYLPLFAVPALSLVGYELYKHAKQRQADDPLTALEQQLREITREEQANSQANNPEWHQEWEKPSLEWGRRLAVVGAGLVVGGAISRHLSLANEFRADRAAVMVSKNPEEFIHVLQKFDKVAHEVMEPQLKDWVSNMSRRSFFQNTRQIYEQVKGIFKEMTYSAHPEDLERFTAIRKVGKEIGAIPLR